MKLRGTLAGVVAMGIAGALVAPVWGQAPPPEANAPVQVIKGRGEFAKKLNGSVMPSGKGWKSVADRDKRLQIMIPEKWKVDNSALGDTVIRAMPPGNETDVKAALLVMIAVPRDADPFEIDEAMAATYADSLARDPSLARHQFQATDGGYVLARNMKFALAGGTMKDGKKNTYCQQQLVYISEDRIVTIQFAATDSEFQKHRDDVAKIFASYQTLGAVKVSEDRPDREEKKK
jgi:hypothetical protein